MVKNIIYIKTPKCSSTSTKNSLLDFANKNNMKILNSVGFKNEFNLNNYWIKKVTKYDIFSPIHDNQNYNISLDHVTATNANIARLLEIMSDNDYLLISSVREPLNRLISNYLATPINWDKSEMGFTKWYLKNKDKNVAEIFKGTEKIFPDFWINNFMCNYLSVDVNDKNCLDKYDFITITEHYSESMRLLSKKLRYDLKVTHLNKTNKPKITVSD